VLPRSALIRPDNQPAARVRLIFRPLGASRYIRLVVGERRRRMTTLHQWGEPVPDTSTGHAPINCSQALGQLDEFVVYTPLALARGLGRVATLRSFYYREGTTQGASQKGTS